MRLLKNVPRGVRRETKTALASFVAGLMLVACGGGDAGGGGDLPSQQAPFQQGLYLGKSLDFFDDTGSPSVVLILENQEVWVVQEPAAYGATRALFAQGTFAYSGLDRTFAQLNALVSWQGAALQQAPMTLNRITTTAEAGLKPVAPAFNSSYAPGAWVVTPDAYEYNRPARISDLLGIAWRQYTTTSPVPITINEAGAFSAPGPGTGCTVAGTLTPRPSGTNVFNASFTVAGCPAAGSYSGVAVRYVDALVPALRILGIDQSRSKAFSVAATRSR